MSDSWKTTHFNGYDVIDKGNGLSTIVVPDISDKKPADAETETAGFFARLLNWFKTSAVAPYVKIRDLADPTGGRRDNPDDIDAGNDGKPAGEIGIKIKF